MPKALFIDATAEIEHLWRRIDGAGAITLNKGPVAEDEIAELLHGYDTCIVDATYLTDAAMSRCSNLKHIVFLGSGAGSFIDLAAAERLGIKVSTIRGYGDTAVAEHAMGLLFAAARRIAQMHTILRTGGWQVMQGTQLNGKTLGLLGLGGIGREMARLGNGVGLKTIAFNRSPLQDALVPLVSIDELLAQSDVVSLHLALNDGTRRFLDRGLLRRLKTGVILVNTARAGLVDEVALAELLGSGHIGHYATDVYSREPPNPDEPLLTLDNVTLTAHSGYNTPEAAITMYRRAIDLAVGEV
jgi:D-3-phosphoglycerate dehydrogenase / 2-oxoglutarate reductase